MDQGKTPGEKILQKIYWEIGGKYPQRTPWQPCQLGVAKNSQWKISKLALWHPRRFACGRP